MADLGKIFKDRKPNIYEQIGLLRSSNIFEIEEAFSQYDLCMIGDPDCKDIDMAGPIYKLNLTEINDIHYVLKKPLLREIYDKTETFIRKKYDPSKVPSEGSRYFRAISEISHYSIYVLIMFMFVEQHQNFAKSMTISTLLLFATMSVQLKMPKQGNEESYAV